MKSPCSSLCSLHTGKARLTIHWSKLNSYLKKFGRFSDMKSSSNYLQLFAGVDGCALENLKCEQQCDFSAHGYKCSCARGYRLAANQQDCVGKQYSYNPPYRKRWPLVHLPIINMKSYENDKKACFI